MPDHKQTRQREVIMRVISALTSHLTAEEIVLRVKEKDESIGAATVYRTIKLLVDKGILSPRSFDEKAVRYELVTTHHDHLVCTRCGAIIEFVSADIEEHQHEITRKHAFTPSAHSLIIYGVCAECRQSSA
ncbi:hypothetical protein AUK40_02740 [Candidatus Wirthbacteria bacterium CG2_30_54_11]|uniref:Transcriptional repressor n=1 Tax=Candidatus Wirthbacteria bacterium CG2_30_54_11 TaxID=1817892 RepID=A0A1J5IZF4_9BACT|nr:MAG: hypothetical protein AUK40_02740 [Candidatus Wirthbacteria bacterium CG2_30_54_11]